MAYDASFYGAFSGRPAYQIRLYVRRDQTDAALNRSSYAWQLLAEKVSSGTTWTANSYPWAVSVAGQSWSGNAAALDFRATNSISIATGSTGWIAHNSAGNLTVAASAWYHTGGSEYFGNADASGSFQADTIFQLPGATVADPITNVTPTTIFYSFSSTTNGGSAITGYQAQIATNASFTTGSTTVNSDGTTTFTGLTAGVTYYIRSRAQNAIGYGPWSTTSAAATLSGALVGKNSNFLAAGVYVGTGSIFSLAEVRVGKGGIFVIAS